METPTKPKVTDNPEGKFELSLRVLGNELIAIKMLGDDFKMKWVLVGLFAMVVVFYTVAVFGPAIMHTFAPQSL